MHRGQDQQQEAQRDKDHAQTDKDQGLHKTDLGLAYFQRQQFQAVLKDLGGNPAEPGCRSSEFGNPPRESVHVIFWS